MSSDGTSAEPPASASDPPPAEPPLAEPGAAEVTPAEPVAAAPGLSMQLEVVPDPLPPGTAAESPRHRPWWRRHRRWKLVGGGVALIVAGGSIVAGGYYATVPPTDLSPLPAWSTLHYRDGTVLGHIGDIRRDPVAYEDLLPEVVQAAVAAQDPNFWTNRGGVIARGAVRLSLGLGPRGNAERFRVGVQAVKLDGTYPKQEILEYWLNGVAFGRQSYGVEAAAETFLGKSARRSAPPEQQLTPSEAFALLAMVDQPEPNPDDPEGSPGFDPVRNERAAGNSRRRWAEIRDAVVRQGSLSRADADRLVYPIAWRPVTTGPEVGPVGLVVNQVLSELNADGSPFRGRAWREFREGGYDIVTTLDSRAQAQLEKAADPTQPTSAMYGEPAVLQAAAVVVEPGTGRVLAYYGGSTGTGSDFAGVYLGEDNEWSGLGAHPPGGTFLVHTLAAALRANISLRSYWEHTPHDQPGRARQDPIRNNGVCPSDQLKLGACTLVGATIASLNVPYYDVTVSVSPAKVLEMARDAGIDSMWTDDRIRQDLRNVQNMPSVTPSKFDIVLGLGQYPVTVLDQANAMATYAAGGLRARAHFVGAVRRGDKVIYGESLPNPNQPRILSAANVADLDWVLSQTTPATEPTAAVKTGVWEYNNRADQNAHAWVVGYTGSLAMAVWVGNNQEERALVDIHGSTVWGSGLPSVIFRDFMTGAHTAMGLHPAPFPPPVFAGQVNPPGSAPR